MSNLQKVPAWQQSVPTWIKNKIESNLSSINREITYLTNTSHLLNTAIKDRNYNKLPNWLKKRIKNRQTAVKELYYMNNSIKYLKSARIAYNKLNTVYNAKEEQLKAAHELELTTERSNVQKSEAAKKAAENAQATAEETASQLQNDIADLQKLKEDTENDYKNIINNKDTTIDQLNTDKNELNSEIISMNSQLTTKDATLEATIQQHDAAMALKDAEITNKLVKLQGDLEELIGILSSDSILTGQVISNQNNMSNYLSKEQTRLTNEKNRMEEDVDLIKREALLSDTRKKRTMAYNYILVVFILTMALALVFHYLKKSFIFIPSFLFNFLIVFTLSGGLMYMINLYLDIIKRDPIYYDKLMLSPPANADIAKANASNNKTTESETNGLGSTCQKADCCDKVTNAWNEDKGLCMPIDKSNEETGEAFTNIFKSECCKI